MRTILVTGGARSGKSHYAERRAAELGGDDVTFVATATAGDDEMAARIAKHRAERPAAWRTMEAPEGAGRAMAAAPTPVVLLDCLTLLTSNALLTAVEADVSEDAAHVAVEKAVDELLQAAAARNGILVAVTNEVGWGLVPEGEIGRWFRDALGRANRRVAEQADEVVLMVAGLPIALKGPARELAVEVGQ